MQMPHRKSGDQGSVRGGREGYRTSTEGSVWVEKTCAFMCAHGTFSQTTQGDQHTCMVGVFVFFVALRVGFEAAAIQHPFVNCEFHRIVDFARFINMCYKYDM